MNAPVLIACVGNPAAGDDALGSRVHAALQGAFDEDVEIVDLAMKPAALFDYLDGRDALFVVDAVVDASAGRLVDCDLGAIPRPALSCNRTMSTHGFDLAGQIALAERLRLVPRIARFLGLTIESAAPETSLGCGVAAAIPRLLKRLTRRVRWARLMLDRERS
jgi:hydrogenase maturation protease